MFTVFSYMINFIQDSKSMFRSEPKFPRGVNGVGVSSRFLQGQLACVAASNATARFSKSVD